MARSRLLAMLAGQLAELTDSDSAQVPVAASLPVSPAKGETCVLTTNGHLYTYDGSGWVDNGAGGSIGGVSIDQVTFTISPSAGGYAENTVSVPGVLATTKVIAYLVPNTDWDADDLQGIEVFATPGLGTITFTTLRDGPLGGDITVNYIVYGLAFDPGTLALSGWFRPDYTASPWTGSASLGGSGSKSLTEATNAPGTFSLGSYTVADFDGVNDLLTQSSGPISDYVTAGAGTIAALVNLDTITGGNATGYLNPAIVGETGGFFGLFAGTATNDKFSAYLIDGAAREIPIAASTGSWAFLFMTWDGSNLKFSVNGGTLFSTAAGTISSVAGTMKVGRGYSANFLDGKVAELMFSQTALTIGDRDNIRSYLNSRYGAAGVAV